LVNAGKNPSAQLDRVLNSCSLPINETTVRKQPAKNKSFYLGNIYSTLLLAFVEQ